MIPQGDSPTHRFTLASTYAHTRRPVEAATTLPPDCYRLSDYHDLEMNRVFGQSWVCVGYSSQVRVPGQMLAAEVAGQPIVVTRDKTNQLRAFFNVCRHRGSILVAENTHLERFRCPYHSWTYDLTGKLLSCPLFAMAGACKSSGAEDGSGAASFQKEDYSLLPVRVARWGCFIFVALSETAPSLDEYLGDLPTTYNGFPLGELVHVKRKRYEIKANWKLIAENFLEYYHLPWVHPELTSVTAIDLHRRNQGSGMYMSFYASPLLKAGLPIDADYLPAMPGLSLEEANSGYFPYIFPNVAMFMMPHHLFVLLMAPSSIANTHEFGDILVHPNILNRPDTDQKLEEIFKFYDMVNLQDILAVERVQTGIRASAYQGGRMSYRFEEPVHRFQNMVIDYMTGERRTYAGDKPQQPSNLVVPITDKQSMLEMEDSRV